MLHVIVMNTTRPRYNNIIWATLQVLLVLIEQFSLLKWIEEEVEVRRGRSLTKKCCQVKRKPIAKTKRDKDLPCCIIMRQQLRTTTTITITTMCSRNHYRQHHHHHDHPCLILFLHPLLLIIKIIVPHCWNETIFFPVSDYWVEYYSSYLNAVHLTSSLLFPLQLLFPTSTSLSSVSVWCT